MTEIETALADALYEALDKALIAESKSLDIETKAFHEGEAIAYQTAINLITNANALANSRVLRECYLK